MKIKTTTGKIINTSKLGDMEAEVSEIMNQLYEVCSRYNCTLFAKAIVSDQKFIGAQNKMSGPKGNDSMAFLFNLINLYCMETTGGEIKLIKTNGDDQNEENLFS